MRPGDVHDSTGETGRSLPASGSDPTELPRFNEASPLELATTRVRLAQQMFGIAVAAPRIGRFHVLEKLGEGAMGEVYAAFDPELDRRVAIKVLHSQLVETPDGRDRLLREAQALARVSHPNVVQVFEVGFHLDHVFVAMEYVRGESVAHLLERQDEPMDWKAALRLFVAAGHGLAAVHAAGLVHRDFKPANTIVGDDGRPRILDFGLARALKGVDSVAPGDPASPQGRLDTSLTGKGSVIGTPAYMAPEVLEGQRADARSDQYSYCTALFEALHGFRPHAGEAMAALAAAKFAGNVRPPPGGTKVPAWLHAAVLRGLEVAPERRWPTMAALLAELGRDRGALRRAWLTATAGLGLLALTAVAVREGLEQRRIADDQHGRAEAAERDAAGQNERARRLAFERSVLAEAERSVEVTRLAQSEGRARDAMVLGIQTLARYGPDFDAAPLLAIDGIAHALPALIASRTLPGDGERLVSVALSPDGAQIATLDAGDTLRLWDAADGKLRASGAWSGGGASASFSPDGGTILVSTDDRAERNPATDQCTLFAARDATVLHAVPRCRYGLFAPDGAAFHGVITEDTARVAAWDPSSGARRWNGPSARRIEALAIDRAGTSLFAAQAGGDVQVIDAVDGRSITLLRAPAPGRRDEPSVIPDVQAIAVAPDGKRLAVSGRGVHLWDLPTRRHLGTPIRPGGFPYTEMTFSIDGEFLLASNFSNFHAIDAASASVVMTSTDPLFSLTALGDGKVLAVNDDARLMVQWSDGALIDHVRADASDIMGEIELGVSANLRRAATGRTDVRLWNLADPRVLASWRPPEGVRATLHAGRVVVTEAPGRVVRVHDRRTGAVLGRIAEEPAGVDDAEPPLRDVHVAGDRMWSRRGDELRLHDLRDGHLIQRQRRSWPASDGEWYLPHGAPRSFAVTAEGSIDVFETASGALRCTITGEAHRYAGAPAPGVAIVLSRDGERIAVLTGERNPITTDLIGAFRITTWSTTACEMLATMDLPIADRRPLPLLELAFAENGSLVTRVGITTHVHDPATGRLRFRAEDRCTYDHLRLVGASELSPDGATLLTSCDGRSFLWSLSGEEPVLIDLPTRTNNTSIAHYATGRRRSFFRDGERVLLTDEHGGLVVWDTVMSSTVIRLRAAGPLFINATVALDGETIEYHGPPDTLVTYPSSRNGLIAAACRALSGSEVWNEVARECGLVIP